MLETRLGHEFSDPELLRLALSHASIGARSNERLEFLGDRVLGLIVAEWLYADYPDIDEGGLAVRLNALVRRDSCAKAGEAAGLAAHLIMAASESGSGGRQKGAILAGACEAVIAALYLDGGFAAAKRFVLTYWEEQFASLKPELRDAKTALQEWAQSGALPRKTQPAYAVKERSGPDHAPVFTVEVRIAGHEGETGEGSTKREAEQDAARRMLERLGLWKA
ncbi:MAG TPA: ribonuclease III [Micropepsaceae bacterium]